MDETIESFLTVLGIARPLADRARQAAATNGSAPEEELIAAGAVGEVDFYRTMAAFAGLPFLDEIAPGELEMPSSLDRVLRYPRTVRLHRAGGGTVQVIAPRLDELARLKMRLGESTSLQARLAISAPSELRRAAWARGAHLRVQASVQELFDMMPDYSARIPLHPMQAFLAGMGLSGFATLLLLFPGAVLAGLGAIFSCLYMATIVLRLTALVTFGEMNPPAASVGDVADGPFPVYTVLVPLYREAGMVEQLVAQLKRLDWLASRLDIKLICEEADPETRTALLALPLPPWMEVVTVPGAAPRTKPKALTYALKGARGEFVTVYDAEDRPGPQQLREAWRRFRRDDPALACLQAPLVITNGGTNWLSDLFALEYVAQFHGFLPFLASRGWPLPLGGTSNHFRRHALVAAGGWDPYNVTEDADLGLRLARLGYRTGLIATTTLEDAPTRVRVWINQRSRWYKGWMQTLLVGSRHPATLIGQIGWIRAAAFTLATAGMVASALFFPALVLVLASSLYRSLRGTLPPLASLEGLGLAADAVNLILGIAYFALTALLQARRSGSPLAWRQIVRIPALWTLLSLAAWRALGQMLIAPHAWDKTPHEPSPRDGARH